MCLSVCLYVHVTFKCGAQRRAQGGDGRPPTRTNTRARDDSVDANEVWGTAVGAKCAGQMVVWGVTGCIGSEEGKQARDVVSKGAEELTE